MRRLSAVLTLLLGTASVPASAEDWHGGVTLYGWIPSIVGAQEGPDGSPIIDLDGEDLLEALQFVFSGIAEFRRDRFGILIDMLYVDLASDAQAQPPFSAEAAVETQIGFISASGAWRLHGDKDDFIDAYGGVRYYATTLDFDISLLGGGVDRSFSADVDWFDPIIGLRARHPISNRWSLVGFADVGGFGLGSELTWQAYAGINYAFSESFEGNLGYRHMSIDYDDEIKLDIELAGPVVGLTWRF